MKYQFKSFSMRFRGDKNVFRVILSDPQVVGALRIAGFKLKLMLQNGTFCLSFSKILSVIDFITGWPFLQVSLLRFSNLYLLESTHCVGTF